LTTAQKIEVALETRGAQVKREEERKCRIADADGREIVLV